MCHCQSTRLIQTLDTLDLVNTNYSKQLSSVEALLDVTQSRLVHEQTENTELREAVLILTEAVERCNGVFKGWPHCNMKVAGRLAEPMKAPIETPSMPEELHAHLPSVVAVLRQQLADERESHRQTTAYVAQLETMLALRDAELKLACSGDLTQEAEFTDDWDEKIDTLGVENVLGSPLQLRGTFGGPHYDALDGRLHYDALDDETTLAWAGPSTQPMKMYSSRSRSGSRRRMRESPDIASWSDDFFSPQKPSGSRVMQETLLTPSSPMSPHSPDSRRHALPHWIASPSSPPPHSPLPSDHISYFDHNSTRSSNTRKPRTKTQALRKLKQRIDYLARDIEEFRESTLRLTAATSLVQGSVSLSDVTSSAFDSQLPVSGGHPPQEQEGFPEEREESDVSMSICSPLPQASGSGRGLQLPDVDDQHTPPSSAVPSPILRPSLSLPLLICRREPRSPTNQPVSSPENAISPLSLSDPLQVFFSLPSTSDVAQAPPRPPVSPLLQPTSSLSIEEGGDSAIPNGDDTQTPLPIPPPFPTVQHAPSSSPA